MTQPGLDQDFRHMSIQDPRKQLSPSIARKPQSQAPAYRAGPAPFRGYHDTKDDFPPPPPPTTSYIDQHNFPPPPPESKENIYHEIQDTDFPPPPPTGPPGPPGEYSRGPDMHMRGYGQSPYSGAPISSYESRHESQTLVQPSGRYEREVKQATYSVQSSDSSGRSSPYGSNYANTTNTYGTAPMSQTYNTSPMSQTYGQTGPYGQVQYAKPSGVSPSRYSPSSPRQNEDSGSGVTYASIAQDTGVTYAQIKPRSDRAVPGPQVPVQMKVTTDSSQGYLTPNQARSFSGSSPGQQYVTSAPMYSTSMSPKATSEAKGVNSKEQEVDALTQMLMQGLEGTKDPDFFGVCAKCGKKVVGESNGCTAMDQVFHIACFCCIGCSTQLRGESFYAMERKPFCEPCYVNTLERCSICSKPITDRLLRATGKPYHPACFTCVVCGVSLDGIPFTVDATNQIHCIDDFHKKFAPRCCVCHNPIMPEKGQEETVRVVAMDRSFHVGCYRCEDCDMLLSSEAEGRGCYPLDDHILCKNCNAKRINALTTKLSTEL